MKNKIVAVILAAALSMTPAVQILAEDVVLDVAEETVDGVEDYEDLNAADYEGSKNAEVLRAVPDADSQTTEETTEDADLQTPDEITENADSQTPDETTENSDSQMAFDETTDSLISSDETTSVPSASEADNQSGSDQSFSTDTSAESMNLSGEIAVLSVEELTDCASEPETEILTDTVEGEVLQSGLSTNASPARLRLFAEHAFDGCYGNQLDGTARTVYDAMVAQYVNSGLTGELTIELSNPVTFQTLGTPNGSGGLVWNSSENAEYQQKIGYSMQAAYDAFIYDYPQVFWMNTFYYSTSISFSGGQGSYTGKAAKIRLIPAETYEGASGETDQFKSAVAAAVTELNLQSGASEYEKVKAVHDYLCEKLVYGNENKTYAHSAAGVFLKDGVVVCEGYAKAFKILCGQLGIECVLIVGNTESGGHMWNYVRMDDGNWYLADTTWDDSEAGGASTGYFLAGSNTVGFYQTPIFEERTIYTNFSGAVYTNYFTGPVLNAEAYVEQTPEHTHTWQVTEEKEPTCQEDGYCISVCTVCQEISRVVLEKNVTKATINGQVVEKQVHRFEDGLYIDNEDATCTTDGTITLLCDYGCGTTGGKVVVKGSAKGHSFVNYVSNKDATFSADGTKTASCANGCGATRTVTDRGTKVKLNVSSLRLQKGKSTTRVKVIGLPSGVKVKKWKSSNTRIFSVTSKGKITAKKAGTAKLTVTIGSGKRTSSRTITVKVQSGVVKTTGISVSTKTVTLKKGRKHRIAATVSPITSGQKITYTSSNKKVAVVSAKGVVTAKGAGTTKITVKSGSKKCTVTIKVPKTKTKKLKNLPSKLTLRVGKTKQLSPKRYPTNSDEKIYYKSSRNKVAAISAKGKITAKKAGITTITVKSGKVVEKFKLTVKK